jgi:hypothetical protein
MPTNLTEILWTGLAFVLTLCIFSYLFGDNFLFRIATYILVGVSSGYVFYTIFFQVLWPRLVVPLQTYEFWKLLIMVVPPFILGALLLTKISPRLASLGTLPMAYLVGVGAAVAVGGAVYGTLFGQVKGAAAAAIASIEGFIVLVGTICTLAYFQFGALSRPGQAVRRSPLVEWLASAGQVFIGITLGALFAGVYAASLTALMERLEFLLLAVANWIHS